MITKTDEKYPVLGIGITEVGAIVEGIKAYKGELTFSQLGDDFDMLEDLGTVQDFRIKVHYDLSGTQEIWGNVCLSKTTFHLEKFELLLGDTHISLTKEEGKEIEAAIHYVYPEFEDHQWEPIMDDDGAVDWHKKKG